MRRWTSPCAAASHGGVFSPSLILGSVFGAGFGSLMAAVFPECTSGSAAYALVGEAATSSAVLGAPISTALIVFELTADYHLAVMVAVVVANQAVRARIGVPSFFPWQLYARGVDLETASPVTPFSAGSPTVAEAMWPVPLDAEADRACAPRCRSRPTTRSKRRWHTARSFRAKGALAVAARGPGASW